MQHAKTRWIRVGLLAGLIAVSACSRDKAPDPSPVELAISASSQVNPDRNDRPSPVLVRVYELRSPGTFETADFFALIEQDQAVLGREMVNRWEFQLDPGEQRTFEASFDAASGFLGLVAAFRDIEHARWRAATPIRSGSKNELDAAIGRLDVSIEAR